MRRRSAGNPSGPTVRAELLSPVQRPADRTNEIVLCRLPNADGSHGQPSADSSSRDPVGLRPGSGNFGDRRRGGPARREEKRRRGRTRRDRTTSKRRGRVLRHSASKGRSNRGDVKRRRLFGLFVDVDLLSSGKRPSRVDVNVRQRLRECRRRLFGESSEVGTAGVDRCAERTQGEREQRREFLFSFGSFDYRHCYG